MHFVQYYLDCLSQASYLVGDEGTGRAVVVDPRRDVEIYLDDADAHDLRIERVIETHIHADFLSGHLELAAKTGAAISYGEGADVDFPIEPLRDGEQLRLGDVTLQVLATPGHTPESISVIVRERTDDTVPYGVLTGDTMFIGDVGRPDLLNASRCVGRDTGARSVSVSARPARRVRSMEAAAGRAGEGAERMTPPDVDHVDPTEGRRRVDAGALLLDVRNPDEWHAGHAEGAAWIPMGELAERQEELPTDREIVVICKTGARSAQVAKALVAAGYGAVNVAGGSEAWQAAGLAIVTDDGRPGTVA